MTDHFPRGSDTPENQWRSLAEQRDSSRLDGIRTREFPSGVTDDFDTSQLSAMSRKQFLGLLTASAAFATTGCSLYRDKGEIVPYTSKPEEITPGISNTYASTCTGCAQACGTLIKTREGRPVKIDGNPDHPVNAGTLCPRGQASILNLYDPDRLRAPFRGNGSSEGRSIPWSEVDATMRETLRQCVREGKEISLVTRSVQSPSFAALLKGFADRYPTARVYVHELFHEETRLRAWKRSYGGSGLPSVAWERARLIVVLEADILGTEGSVPEQIRGFAATRNVQQTAQFSRLYVVEAGYSVTGTNADYRLRLRPDAQAAFVLGILHELVVVRNAVPVDRTVAERVASFPLSRVVREFNLPATHVDQLVEDLLSHRGRGIVYAGRGLDEDAHVAVNLLNEALGNTALYRSESQLVSQLPLTAEGEWSALAAKMRDGRVGAVLHLNCNPVFHLPRSLGYADALAKVPRTVSLAETADETSAVCSMVLPINHMLESWGDAETRAGVFSLQQPVIAPLHDSRQMEAVLLTWMTADGPYTDTIYHEFLQERWKRETYPATGSPVAFRQFWFAALERGVVSTAARPDRRLPLQASAFLNPPATAGAAQIVVLFTEHPFLGDGRFANNGWLQELPHPVSRVVWDNYAAVSPSTATVLGAASNDLVEVEVEGRAVTLPLFVQAGMAEGCVAVTPGHGRWAAGTIGTGVGRDAGAILPPGGLTGPRYFAGRITRRPGEHLLVSTEEHHPIDDSFLRDLHRRRNIVREGTVAGYAADPGFLHTKKQELFSISKEVTYPGLKWAMAIDMNKCVGCAVCVTACNVENNVPVVGKEQVAAGREMQWIRIDRHFSGTPEDPVASHQPMLCQHCDNAPCENVCPVVATNHSPDGLNQMVYNRCVGTKYCSNNCPYKVRRFNFLNFRDNLAGGYQEADLLSLMHNPEVTVRSRGVMEKCTFCVQRIMEARQLAAENGRELAGSDVQTACQVACPARAIVFGDMNDAASPIALYRTHELGYHVLEETNVRPNVTYLARLRNTEPEGRS